MSEWESTKKELRHLDEWTQGPIGGGTLGKNALDHALFAKALRLIMEKLEAS